MPRRDILLAVAVAAVWGVNFTVVSIGLKSWPPLLFAAIRFVLVAFPAVLVIRPPRTRDWRLVVGVGLFQSTLQFAFVFVGMDLGVPAGLASVALQIQVPFTMTFAALLLRERPRPVQIAGAVLAFAGIGLLGASRTSSVPGGAFAFVLIAAACWAAGNICARLAQADRALSLLVWSSLVPPIPLFLLSLAFEGPRAFPEAMDGLALSGVLAMAYVVAASTWFAYSTWNGLLRRHPASRVAPFSLLVPVAGIAAAWLVLDEVPSAVELAGAATVMAGLSLSLRVPQPAAASVAVIDTDEQPVPVLAEGGS